MKRGTWLLLAVIAVLFAALFYFYSRPARQLGPAQPISFSHRVHAGVKAIDCRFCHPGVERSPNAGLPAVEKCFYCHKYIIPQHPEIVREEEYLKTGKTLAWKRVFWVPDFVFFNHIPHIKWAKLDCARCHGNVKSEDRLQQVNFQMGFCIECHRKMNAQLDCWLGCHR
jgi:predicted CXXCH cytochrome family protein